MEQHMNYYTCHIQCPNVEPVHLQHRIHVTPYPGQRAENNAGIVSQTDGPFTQAQVRQQLAEAGIDYPPQIPLVFGDYSVSNPAWNTWFYEWSAQPQPGISRLSQPVWYQHSTTPASDSLSRPEPE